MGVVIRRFVAAGVMLPAAGAALVGVDVLLARRGHPLVAPAGAPPAALAPRPGAPEQTVVWLGDSTAAGIGASEPAATLPQQVAARLGAPVRLTVLAHSGDRLGDVLAKQLPAVAAFAPSAVFISVGANDAIHLTSQRRFRRDYARLLAALPASATEVVVLGVPDLGAPRRLLQPLRALAGWRGRALDRDVRSAARTGRAIYIDIAGRAGPAFRRHPHRYLAADDYHPSDAGYTLWADAVAAVVASTAVGEARRIVMT